MNKREFWLLVGLIMALASLPVLGLWQQARYRKAQQATQEFIAAQQRAETDEPAAAALFRQAQPQLRRDLAAGDFNAALQRLTALQDEDDTPASIKAHGKALSLNQLWPPQSPARNQARQVLKLMAQKQAQGYDLSGAQEALLQVANAARQGDKKQALAAFASVAMLIRTATLRAGFLPASAKAPAMSSGVNNSAVTVPSSPNSQRLAQLRQFAAGGRGAPGQGRLPPVTPGQMQQLEQSIQTFQLVLPQLMERATPEQRVLLQRLQPFLSALLAAYHQGKDIRPVMPFLQQFMAAGKRNPGAASALLDQAWAALNTAKPMAEGVPPNSTAPQSHFKRPPLPTQLPVPPAKLAESPHQVPVMAAGHAPPGAMSGPPQTQRILQMLDVIRKLPEPVYQQQRPQIARYIDGAMASMGGKPRGISSTPHSLPERNMSSSHATPPLSSQVAATPLLPVKNVTLSVGTTEKLRVDFARTGQITGLWGLGHDLAPGLAPGGVTLQTDNASITLQGTTKGDSNAIAANLAGNGGVNCALRAAATGRDLTLSLQTQRKVAGPPATLILRIPMQAAGWHWDNGDAAQVIALDGTYTATADSAAKLPMITLRGPTTRLAVLAPTATTIAYDPVGGTLELRFAISSAAGEVEHTVSFTISH